VQKKECVFWSVQRKLAICVKLAAILVCEKVTSEI